MRRSPTGILATALLLTGLAAASGPPDPAQHLADELRELLGRPLTIHRSEHFVIVHDADDVQGRGRAALLERTREQFYASMHKLGLEPRPHGQPLIAIFFRQFEDYARYAQWAEGELPAFTGGYYSLRTNRIAFHDDRTSPQLDEPGRQLDELQTAIAQAHRSIAELRRAGLSAAGELDQLRRLQHERRWLSNRLDAVTAGSNDAKAVHEAVHQLAFNSGVQDPRVEYPLWVTEGLAMLFEGGHDNPLRRKLLVDAHARGRLMRLSDFAVLGSIPDDADHRRAVELYAQGWGFFRYLFHRRNGELAEYLKLLAAAPHGPRAAELMRGEIEAAFGPIPKLERAFSGYVRWLRK